jgi:hypothetical protein
LKKVTNHDNIPHLQSTPQASGNMLQFTGNATAWDVFLSAFSNFNIGIILRFFGFLSSAKKAYGFFSLKVLRHPAYLQRLT